MIVTHELKLGSYEVESDVNGASALTADESRSMGGGGRRKGC
jgi:hypothetical protein